jgi:hypothetical protein
MIPLSHLLQVPDVCIDHIEIHQQAVCVSLHLETQGADCPLCRQRARRVQSRYLRTLHDLPKAGRAACAGSAEALLYCLVALLLNDRE